MNKLKKLGIVALSVVTVIGLSGVSPANAQTVSELQAQIQSLLAQLQALQAQQGGGSQTGGGVAVSCDFTRNLYPGDSGPQVKCLQRYLNAAGYTVADSGVGSPGNETEYYGSLTQSAVTEWQDAQGLDYGQWGGYFGPSSQAKYNELAAAAPAPGEGEGTSVVVPEGTDLVVEEASDAPGEKILGSGTSFNPVLKVKLSAGDSDVEVSSVTLKRGGFISNTNLSGVDVVDSKGVRHGNVITSINADNTINIPMSSKPIVVEAGTSETLTFRVNIASGASSGSVNLSLQSISSDASNIDSSYPIAGSTMQIVSASNSIATVTFDVQTSTGSSTINVDPDSSQEITRFRIKETSSNEKIELKSLKLYNYGNASDSDYKDVTLKTTGGDVLDIAQPDGQWVTFNLSDDPYVMDKGQTKDLIVEAKITGGTTKTLRFVVYNDYDVEITGQSTGVSVIPSAGSTHDSSFPIGDSANLQTIGSGSMSLSRASDSPSDSVVPAASGVTLAKFNARPTGEDYELRKVQFKVATTSGSDVALTGTVYVKVNGSIVYSTAASNVPSDTETEFTLSSYPTLTAGQDNTIEIVADISSSATVSETYKVENFDLTQAKRLVTNDLVNPSGTASGYTIGVSAADLSAITLNEPVSGSVVAGTSNFELAKVELNSSAGGEDVEITDITFATSGASDSAAADTDLGNFKLYKNGEELTTTNSTSQMGSDGEVKFNLRNRLLVPKSDSVTLSLKADILSGANDTDKYTFKVKPSGVTAVGADTGNTVSNLSISGNGQEQEIAANGKLFMTLLSGSGGSPSVDQVKAVGNTDNFFAMKMSSRYEDVKITSLTFTATSTGGSLSTSTLSDFKLYEGSVGVGNVIKTKSQPTSCGSNECKITFTHDTNVFNSAVPTTGKELYLTAKISDGDKSQLGDDFRFEIATTTDVTAKGAASAATISGSDLSGTPNASGYTYITSQDVEVTGKSPADTTPAAAGAFTVAKFKVTNNGDAPIYLSTSTLAFTQSGSATTSVGYKLYASAIGGSETDISGWNSGSGYAPATGTGGASTTIDFNSDNAPLSKSEAKIDAGTHRWLTLKTDGASVSGNSYQISVSSLGNVIYDVDEHDLGYDGNNSGGIDAIIRGLYTSGKPAMDIVTAD